MAERDEVLLGKWRDKRDTGAFGEIVRRYSATVYGTARRILGDAGHAEDVTQECFYKLLSCPLSSSRALRLGAWLHRVATNLSLDVLRREQSEVRLRSERPPQHEHSGFRLLSDQVLASPDHASQKMMAANLLQTRPENHGLLLLVLLGLVVILIIVAFLASPRG